MGPRLLRLLPPVPVPPRQLVCLVRRRVSPQRKAERQTHDRPGMGVTQIGTGQFLRIFIDDALAVFSVVCMG